MYFVNCNVFFDRTRSGSMYVPMLFKIAFESLRCWEEGIYVMMLHDATRAVAKESDIVSK